MKKILIIIIALAGMAVAGHSQPRSIGMRIGATGIDIDYQHNIKSGQFVEAGLGLDFGYNAKGNIGVRASAIYDFIWARPAWTQKGRWALYAGPGLSMGYVDDIVPYSFDSGITGCYDNGFMIGVVAQVGLEYSFWFPLSLAVDIRPCFGVHINDGRFRDPFSDNIIYRESKAGFYDNGLLGFAPTISVKYSF